jgi:hypothetical protein
VIWPGAISWVSEGIGEVALDRENNAAITRQKEVYLYFGRRFALGRPLPARSDTNSHDAALEPGSYEGRRFIDARARGD